MHMDLIIGITMICLGLLVSFFVLMNIGIEKRTGVRSGFNMATLSFILITIGIYIIYA